MTGCDSMWHPLPGPHSKHTLRPWTLLQSKLILMSRSDFLCSDSKFGSSDTWESLRLRQRPEFFSLNTVSKDLSPWGYKGDSSQVHDCESTHLQADDSASPFMVLR